MQSKRNLQIKQKATIIEGIASSDRDAYIQPFVSIWLGLNAADKAGCKQVVTIGLACLYGNCGLWELLLKRQL